MKCRIITAASKECFEELAMALKWGLEKLGHSVVYNHVTEYTIDEHFDRNFVIRAFRPVPQGLAGERILIQTEQLWNRRIRNYYDMEEGVHRVFEMYKENKQVSKSPRVVWCPLAYAPTFEFDFDPLEIEYDAVTWGALTPRRKDLIGKMNELSHNIIPLQKYGTKRDEYISKSKIAIYIKANPKWFYPPLHMFPAQANNKLCLVEKPDGGVAPYKDGLHFISFSGMGDLNKKMNYWLSHDKEREEFTSRCKKDLEENHTYDKYLEKLI